MANTSAVAAGSDEDLDRREVRARRYRLRRRAGAVTTLKRLRTCGARVVSVEEGVGVFVRPDGIGGLVGVQTCGSVWACPVCSARIREQRAERVEAVATAVLRAGGEVEFVTVTMPHGRTDDLADVLGTVMGAWADVTKDRGWCAASGMVGSVRAVEITDGMPYGWHPHLHVLVFFARGRTDHERAVWRGFVARRWRSSVIERSGREPSAEHGVRIQAIELRGGRADVGEYLSKVQDGYGGKRPVGREMTRGDTKRGRRGRRRGPFDLLEAATVVRNPDRVALARWREYERATKGRRCLEWSRSAVWKAYLAGLQERGDLVPDEPEVVPTPVAELTAAEFDLVCSLDAQLRVVEAAERGGGWGVVELLHSLAEQYAYERARGLRRALARHHLVVGSLRGRVSA